MGDFEEALIGHFGNRWRTSLTEIPYGGEWKFVGSFPISCPGCNPQRALFANQQSDTPFAGFILICGKCFTCNRITDINSDARQWLIQFWELSKGEFPDLNLKKQSIQEGDSSSTEKPLDQYEVVEDFPREKYRLVGWMKESEINALLKAYQKKTNVEILNDDGTVKFTAEWHENDDPIRKKLKTEANVSAVRHRKRTGPRTVAWLHLYELEALLHSLKKEQNVEVKNAKGKVSGAVLYTPQGSLEAEKYSANLCLFRKRFTN